MTPGWAVAGACAGLATARLLARRRYRRPGDAPRHRRPGPLAWLPAAITLAWAVVPEAESLRASGRPDPALVGTWLAASLGLAVLAEIDLDVRRLPDVLTLPAHPVVALALAGCAAGRGDARPLGSALLGGLALQGAYLGVHAAGRGVGLGDVKLAGPIGMLLGFLGPDAWVTGALVTAFSAGAVGILVLARAGPGAVVAHGPAMALGALAGALVPWPLWTG